MLVRGMSQRKRMNSTRRKPRAGGQTRLIGMLVRGATKDLRPLDMAGKATCLNHTLPREEKWQSRLLMI